MMSIVALSVGGSILDDTEYIRKLASVLKKISKENKLYVVAGGGKTARKYIEACRKFGVNESFLDGVGIDATRLNAKVLIAAVGNAYPKPAKDFDEAIVAGKSFSVVVMGGTHPGHTTDAVTAMLAERTKADKLIIATNVDYVYTADPKKYRNAKPLKKLTSDKLIKITSNTSGSAGSKSVIDPLGAKIIARSKIKTFVINGKNLNSLKNVVENKTFVGSVIV
jgi:uridylate kinase